MASKRISPEVLPGISQALDRENKCNRIQLHQSLFKKIESKMRTQVQDKPKLAERGSEVIQEPFSSLTAII
jgi:hypothetical protein